jgi:raffinose/stachyose/melibiose transport system substrate-binding protein
VNKSVRLLWFALLVLGCAAAAFAGGQSGAGAEKVSLTIWWWGEQEAPGAEKWMADTVKAYQAAHPEVSFQTVLQSTDDLVPAFKTAAAAKQGPDIQYFWGGVWTLEDAWAGSLVPISDYMPASEYKHFISNVEREYEGKLWGMGWYLSGNSMAYRKDSFKKAGLAPEGNYVPWADFLKACSQLKGAGIIPIAGGLKDGWFGGWIWQLLGKQGLDSAEDFKKASVGEAKFTDARYADWWSRLNDLKQAGYWNADINSLGYQEGQDLFVRGEAAMIFGNDTFYPGWMKQVGQENFGVMKIPLWGKGKLAPTYTVTAQGLGITSWCAHKKAAADVLVFMHTKQRLEAWYADTGVFPADDRFDTSKVAIPQMKQVFQWIKGDAGPNLENFIPSILDEQGNFAGCQLLFAGEKTPAECAELQQTVIEKWRKDSPEAVENFRKWIKR